MRQDADRRYAEWLARQGPHARDLSWRLANLPWRQRVLLRRHDVRGRMVLDFGCGDGVFTLALARRGARCTGCDIAAAAIAQARAFALGSESAFVLGPPPPGPFDIIFCNQVLEHLDDDRGTLRELRSRLAPGGVLAGTVPLGRFFWDDDHKRVYDESGLRAALEGLGAVRVRRWYRSPMRNWLPWPQRGAAVLRFEVRT